MIEIVDFNKLILGLMVAFACSALAQTSDVAVFKLVDKATPSVSDILNYSITVTNNGPDAATGVTNLDVLPVDALYVSHSNGSYVATSGVWSIGGIAAGSSTTLYINARVLTPPGLASMLHNPSPASGDRFGEVVAGLGSNRIIVGADGDDTGATNAGSVYLLDTNGTLLATIANPDPATDDFFGYSVAALGQDHILVGAFLDDVEAINSGKAYIFDTNGTMLVTLANPDPTVGDQFGRTIAALGQDRVLVSADFDDAGASDAGTVYMFNTNGVLLIAITNPTPATADHFGRSIAALGSNRIVVGAYADNTGASSAGAVYLYSTNGALLVTITNPAPAIADYFGWSVAALGSDQILVGALGASAGGTNAGTVRLFNTNGALLVTITNPAHLAASDFGNVVAGLGSNRILVGSDREDAGATDVGTVYEFDTNGLLVAVIANPNPSAYDSFGNSLAALGNDRIVVGALSDSFGAPSAGSVYFFNPATGGGRIENTARASHLEPDPATANDQAQAYSWVGASGNVALTMRQSRAEAATGQTNIYTIVVSNSGATTMTGVRVAETRPLSGMQILATNFTAGNYYDMTNGWELRKIDPGESQTLTLSVRMTATNAVLTNAVKRASSGQADLIPDDDTSSVVTVVTPTPPQPTNVAVVAAGYLDASNGTATFSSTGTNTWRVLPEYATNLFGAQSWLAASNIVTVWSNGTNVTTFSVPTNAQPAFIRVNEAYP